MNKKIYMVTSIIVTVSIIFSFSASASEDLIPEWIKNTAKWWSEGSLSDTEFINAMKFLIENDIITVDSEEFTGFVEVQGDLFTILYHKEILKNPTAMGGYMTLETQPLFTFDPTKESIYKDIGNLDKKQNTVFVYPMFTQSAYEEPGFYTYYNGECDEKCLTTSIYTDYEATFTSSGNTATILTLLGYDFITDMDIDKNPLILQKYDKIILLHNEYVTKKMFDAITNHPKVIYLYPNALYAEIETDYQENTITLIRGHGFPEKTIVNGFDWEFENTHPYEYDTDCKDWEFYKINNGVMLNCYPEHIIFKDAKLLKSIKDY